MACVHGRLVRFIVEALCGLKVQHFIDDFEGNILILHIFHLRGVLRAIVAQFLIHAIVHSGLDVQVIDGERLLDLLGEFIMGLVPQRGRVQVVVKRVLERLRRHHLGY